MWVDCGFYFDVTSAPVNKHFQANLVYNYSKPKEFDGNITNTWAP